MKTITAALALALLLAAIGVPAQEDFERTDGTDFFSAEQLPDTLVHPDPSNADSTGGIRKIPVVRHRFKYREQVGTALGMMAFIAIILTTVQSWNPD